MILDEIITDRREQLLRDKKKVTPEEIRRRAEAVLKQSAKGEKAFYRVLAKQGLSIIGECKNASPSLGDITSRISLADRIAAYNQSVDAISCLTEERHFKGNAQYFRKIRKSTALPMLRKDFMIEEYQFYEARAMQADAVLLIAAILDDTQLRDFYQLAGELKLDVLMEVHDEKELERALKLDADIIGINNRNLKDFTISLEQTRRLSIMIPADKVLVAESGIVSDEDTAYLAECRVDAFLVGRALMEHDNPKELAARWKHIFAVRRGQGYGGKD